jgi:hypothetical protein
MTDDGNIGHFEPSFSAGKLVEKSYLKTKNHGSRNRTTNLI